MTSPSIVIALGILVLGLATGAASNLTSGGAGVFTIFLLTGYAHLTVQQAVGTVLSASTIFVLIGALIFYQKKQVDGQLSITLGLAGVAGAFFAARIASTLQSGLLEHGLGAFTILVAVYGIVSFTRSRFLKRNLVRDGPGTIEASEAEMTPRWAGKDPLAILVQIGIGVMIGIATGLFGVGGGGLTMAVLLFAFKQDEKLMLGTSLMASFFRYAGGSLGYLSTGQVDPTVFLILAVGGGIGTLLGARVVLRQKKGGYIQVLVVLLLLLVGIEFLAK